MSAAPPYLIGIDLGTTNSAVSYVEADGGDQPGRIRLLDIPQLVAPGETAAPPTLPSFLYLPTAAERESGAVALPWDARPEAVAGVLAREQGAVMPARQISSAKSWLAQPLVDRTARMLPWGVEEPERSFSPVEVSSRYLAHLRDAWNHTIAAGDEARRFERQPLVLTVPASFDEEARELTVQAAQGAGLDQLTLLEEPLAALYAWIAGHRRELRRRLGDGALILVCDVGGGTTDFSLIRAGVREGELEFERIAIGRHLLLGGDNLDLALAARIEQRLAPARLSLIQRQALRRQCSAAKERLLADDGGDAVPLTILGSGRAVVGGTLVVDLGREEVVAALAEFLPVVAPGEPHGADESPDRDEAGRRRGLRELGLPYEREPAVTKHLAAFLRDAARLPAAGGDNGMARPDAVLFNGGFFAPALARERVTRALVTWSAGSGHPPELLVLENARPEGAVAMGAAFYAHLRRHPARTHLLIRAGSGRTYYVGVQGDEAPPPGHVRAVCVMPHGTQEGTRLALQDRDFTVTTNRPIAFTLYSSTLRRETAGEVVLLPGEEVYRHAPLVTILRFGRRSRSASLAVGLSIAFTEVGTLELWCESRTTDHRWRLQFDLRAAEALGEPLLPGERGEAGDDPAGGALVSDELVTAGERLIRDVFQDGDPAPETLVTRIEGELGYGRQAWPVPVIRRLADTLLEIAAGRRKSPGHEARWLNLTGFCLRPGFGSVKDAWRIGEMRAVYLGGLAFPKDVQCQVEWLILWQRVSGGFNAGQQRELYQRVAGAIGAAGRPAAKRLNPQIEREGWRLLSSLERLDAQTKVRLGDDLAARIRKAPRNGALLWSIGRLGARQPFYGPLNTVVPPAAAARWIERLLDLKEIAPDAAWAIAQLGARTHDPVRDVDESLRRRAVERLEAAGAARDLITTLLEPVVREGGEASRFFGEDLPEGLRLGAS